MWRFSSYDVMVICPTWYHLGIYECVLDFAGGGRGNEDTHEYHYCDVVAVATRTRSRTGPGFELVDDASNHVSLMRTMTQDLEIVASSGDRSAIVVGIHDDARPNYQITLQESGIERVLAAVRRMLREKKGGVTPSPS